MTSFFFLHKISHDTPDRGTDIVGVFRLRKAVAPVHHTGYIAVRYFLILVCTHALSASSPIWER